MVTLYDKTDLKYEVRRAASVNFWGGLSLGLITGPLIVAAFAYGVAWLLGLV